MIGVWRVDLARRTLSRIPLLERDRRATFHGEVTVDFEDCSLRSPRRTCKSAFVGLWEVGERFGEIGVHGQHAFLADDL